MVEILRGCAPQDDGQNEGRIPDPPLIETATRF